MNPEQKQFRIEVLPPKKSTPKHQFTARKTNQSSMHSCIHPQWNHLAKGVRPPCGSAAQIFRILHKAKTLNFRPRVINKMSRSWIKEKQNSETRTFQKHTSQEISLTMGVSTPEQESCSNLAHDSLQLNHVLSKKTQQEKIYTIDTTWIVPHKGNTSESMTFQWILNKNNSELKFCPPKKAHQNISSQQGRQINIQCTPASIHNQITWQRGSAPLAGALPEFLAFFTKPKP